MDGSGDFRVMMLPEETRSPAEGTPIHAKADGRSPSPFA